jgi:lipopolysaccharide export LptBFGC system permease protein LptF
MAKEGYSKLALILSLIAAALAFSAAAIEYSRQGEVKLGLIAGGLFLLALGFSAKSRIGR